MNLMKPFGLPPLDTKCEFCGEPAYMEGLCYRHAKAQYADEDEPDQYEDWKNDDTYNSPTHTPYSNIKGKP